MGRLPPEHRRHLSRRLAHQRTPASFVTLSARKAVRMVEAALPSLDPSIAKWPVILPISSLEKYHESRFSTDYSVILFDSEQSRQILRLYENEFLADNPINCYVHIVTDIAESLLAQKKRRPAALLSMMMNGRLTLWELLQRQGTKPKSWRILKHELMRRAWFNEWFEDLLEVFVLGHEIGHFLNYSHSELFQELRGFAMLAVDDMVSFTADDDHQVNYTFTGSSVLSVVNISDNTSDVNLGLESGRAEMAIEVTCDLVGLLLAFRVWVQSERGKAVGDLKLPWFSFTACFRSLEIQYTTRLVAEQYRGDAFPQTYHLHYPRFGRRFWAVLFALSRARFAPGREFQRVTNGLRHHIDALDLSQDAIDKESRGPLSIVDTAKIAIWPEEQLNRFRQEANLHQDPFVFPTIPDAWLDWDELYKNYRALRRDEINCSSLMVGFGWAIRDAFSVFLQAPDADLARAMIPLDAPERSFREDLVDIQACRTRIQAGPFYPFSDLKESDV